MISAYRAYQRRVPKTKICENKKNSPAAGWARTKQTTPDIQEFFVTLMQV